MELSSKGITVTTKLLRFVLQKRTEKVNGEFKKLFKFLKVVKEIKISVVKDLELFRDRTASFRQVQICQQGQLLPVRRLNSFLNLAIKEEN